MSYHVFCLMGPTCSGKTALALSLCEILPLEIISVDSAMVYRGLDIGTAKPSFALRKHITHHLIDIRDPAEIYSAGQFCEDARRLIELISKKGKVPLLVGGTFLYFRALQQGLANLPSKNDNVRKVLMDKMQKQGLASLYQDLCYCDKASAEKINPHDPQRIIRALEVYQLTGKPLSEYGYKNEFSSNYEMLNVGLMLERAWLHQKIEERFKSMLEQGFIEEVEALFQRKDLNENLPSIKSVGYRQAWQYLLGKINYETMVEKTVVATRQLAKRQFTWLRHWPNLRVFSSGCPEEVIKFFKDQDWARKPK